MRLEIFNEKNELIHKSYQATKVQAIDKAQRWINKRKVNNIHNRVKTYFVNITQYNVPVYHWKYSPTFRIK